MHRCGRMRRGSGGHFCDEAGEIQRGLRWDVPQDSLKSMSPGRSSDGVNAVLGLIARNPTLVGGSTAFLVALSFVSANALWYQPHAHSGAFFATRVSCGREPWSLLLTDDDAS